MTIRVRHLGLLALLLVGALPLSIFSVVAIGRSETTARGEVQAGNHRVAQAVAERLSFYLEEEEQQLALVGVSVLLERDGKEAQELLDAYGLGLPNVRDLGVYRQDASAVALRQGAAARDAGDPVLAGALAGRVTVGPLAEARPERGELAHTLTVGVPVRIAGALEGAVLGRLDLIDVWGPVNTVRIGQTGFIRLMTLDGTLLAHGHPEERREVFAGEKETGVLARALLGLPAQNARGEETVVSLALVPGVDWAVVVEQPVAEAFAAANAMRGDLLWFGGATVLFALGLGLLSGRRVVSDLERLRVHTRTLGRGELAARAAETSPVLETRALAAALNEMAASLERLQEQMRARERVTAFGQVAAGLAHDLKHPIEHLRTALYAAERGGAEDEVSRRLISRASTEHIPRLLSYIKDLNALARGQAREDLRITVDPTRVCHEIAETLAHSDRWQKVRFAVEGRAAPLRANPDLVRRAVTNLAANAADACAESGREGTVRLELAGDPRDAMVEIRVHDDGVGMNPETLQKVLASSFQSTKRTTGIGLGLAVVRHVAEMHDGELRVTSTEGEGSCFTLVLARRDGHTHEGAEAPASPTDSGTGRASSPEDAPAVRA